MHELCMDNFYMLVTYTTADLVLQLGTTAASIRYNCCKRLINCITCYEANVKRLVVTRN